jgi:AraC-like DNA-binding protein
MPILLDTTAMSSRQRIQAMSDFLDAEQTPMLHDCPHSAEDMRTWTASWDLGSLQVLQTRGTALRGVRRDREIDATPQPSVSVTYFARGTTPGIRVREEFVGRPGEIAVYDLCEPYGIAFPDGHDVVGIQVLHSDLALPAEVIRRGVWRAHRSPMYELVQRHAARLHRVLPSVDGTQAGRALADVTIDLTRAMLVTAAGDPDSVDVLEQTLPLRVEHYVLEHLADRRLCASQIASRHHVSVRQLYYVWSATHDQSLAEWMMRKRLERGSRELLRTDDPVGQVARRCGFADGAHFSRRFRDRYAASPREWRALHRRNDVAVHDVDHLHRGPVEGEAR